MYQSAHLMSIAFLLAVAMGTVTRTRAFELVNAPDVEDPGTLVPFPAHQSPALAPPSPGAIDSQFPSPSTSLQHQLTIKLLPKAHDDQDDLLLKDLLEKYKTYYYDTQQSRFPAEEKLDYSTQRFPEIPSADKFSSSDGNSFRFLYGPEFGRHLASPKLSFAQIMKRGPTEAMGKINYPAEYNPVHYFSAIRRNIQSELSKFGERSTPKFLSALQGNSGYRVPRWLPLQDQLSELEQPDNVPDIGQDQTDRFSSDLRDSFTKRSSRSPSTEMRNLMLYERSPAHAFYERSPADAFYERSPAHAFYERSPADADLTARKRMRPLVNPFTRIIAQHRALRRQERERSMAKARKILWALYLILRQKEERRKKKMVALSPHPKVDLP